MYASASLSPFQIGTLSDRRAPSFEDYVWTRPAASLKEAPADELQLVTTRAGFEALEDEWNALFERAGRGEQMFQTFNWLWHWAAHFLPDGASNLAIVTVRRSGRLVVVVPLVVERVLGLRQIEFMGAPVSQYGDVLAEEIDDRDAVIVGAIEFALSSARADVLRFAKVRSDAVIAPALSCIGAEITSVEQAPFIDLKSSRTYADYVKRFSNKCFKNRRRLERRLAERGVVGLDWELSGRAAADAARTTLLLKRVWLKAKGQVSRAFADRRTEAFFADVCAGLQRPAGTQVSLLTSGGEIADAAITVTCKGRQALHILAYNMKFEKCAAGVLHVEKLIEHAFETGVEVFDFLAPRHDYKQEWADGEVQVMDFAKPVSVAGRTYTTVYLGFIREHLKAMFKALSRKHAGSLALVQSVMKFGRR